MRYFSCASKLTTQVGGRWWIRTTEVIDDRFTVRLCYSPHVSYNTVLFYLVIYYIEKLFHVSMLTNITSYYCVLFLYYFIPNHVFLLTWQKNDRKISFPRSLCYGLMTSTWQHNTILLFCWLATIHRCIDSTGEHRLSFSLEVNAASCVLPSVPTNASDAK